MIYGHSIRATRHSEAVEQVLEGAGHQAWRRLDEDSRLQMVDQILRPANDLIDAYPLAL